MQAWVLRVLYKDKILLKFILIKNIGCGFSNNDKANADSTGKLTKVRSDGAYFSLGEIRLLGRLTFSDNRDMIKFSYES